MKWRYPLPARARTSLVAANLPASIMELAARCRPSDRVTTNRRRHRGGRLIRKGPVGVLIPRRCSIGSCAGNRGPFQDGTEIHPSENPCFSSSGSKRCRQHKRSHDEHPHKAPLKFITKLRALAALLGAAISLTAVPVKQCEWRAGSNDRRSPTCGKCPNLRRRTHCATMHR
jgi:hypothetical protein